MAERNGGEKLVWFLAGMAIGGALGLLFAPKSGRELRQLIGEKAGEGRDFLVETGRDVYEKGKQMYERGKDIAGDAGELLERGRKAVRL